MYLNRLKLRDWHPCGQTVLAYNRRKSLAISANHVDLTAKKHRRESFSSVRQPGIATAKGAVTSKNRRRRSVAVGTGKKIKRETIAIPVGRNGTNKVMGAPLPLVRNETLIFADPNPACSIPTKSDHRLDKDLAAMTVIAHPSVATDRLSKSVVHFALVLAETPMSGPRNEETGRRRENVVRSSRSRVAKVMNGRPSAANDLDNQSVAPSARDRVAMLIVEHPSASIAHHRKSVDR